VLLITKKRIEVSLHRYSADNPDSSFLICNANCHPDQKPRPMLLLPKFDVVVWIMKTEAFPSLRCELIGLAAGEPDEATEYEGMVDFH